MKTLNKVLKEYPEYTRLINAVIRRVGMSSVKDINNNGIDGGFQGFIYYEDTVKFAKTYHKEILELLIEDTIQLGEDNIHSMVANFGYFRSNKMDNDDYTDLCSYIVTGKSKENTIPNLMAWYAAETVCRWFED